MRVLLAEFALFCAAALIWTCESSVSPVILIPGDGGSRIYAKLNKSSGPHYWCYKQTSYFYLLWLNLDVLFSQSLDCFVDNMRLHYNRTDRRTYNTPGVDIVVPDFGSPQPVETLSDDWFQRYTEYFYKLAEQLVTGSGYVRGQNLLGAPYDFRKAPNELGEFFVNLTRLTERAYYSNNNTRVTLVAHSYGCPLTLHWLHGQKLSWKDKFIERFISMAGPYGGTALSFKVYAAGYNLGVSRLDGHRLRAEQRTSPSLAFLSPSAKIWSQSDVFLSTPTTNYTLSNLQQFFSDIGFPDAWEMWNDVHGLLDISRPPGVETHCVVGRGVPSVERTVYSSAAHFPDAPDSVVHGDGDGTVNWASLSWCTQWIGKQRQRVSFHPFTGVDHMGVITTDSVISFVTQYLLSPA